MYEITIYGRSDDLVEVRGDLREEFPATYGGATHLRVTAETGETLSAFITYNSDGIWQIAGYHETDGPFTVEVVDADDFKVCDYSEALRIGSTEQLSVEKVS